MNKKIIMAVLLLATVFQTKTNNEDFLAGIIVGGVMPLGIVAIGDYLKNIDYSPLIEAAETKAAEVTQFLNAPVAANNGQLLLAGACAVYLVGLCIYSMNEDMKVQQRISNRYWHGI